nr:FAD:protein FMN transferase [Xylophilus sp.]
MPGSFAHSPAAPGDTLPRRADPATLHTLAGRTMGTTWSVRLTNPGFAPLAPARTAIEAALAEVVAQMSHWEPASDLSRFNHAPAGSWHRLPAPFFTVLSCALQWSRDSGGAWDPTVGPLVAAWGFGPRPDPLAPHAGGLPGADALAAARARVGGHRIGLRTDEDGSRWARQPGGAALDFSGIAKGFAVDQVAAALRAAGFNQFLVEVGGELRAAGQRPDGAPWRVAIATLPGQAPRALVLADRAVATSGDHFHVFEHGGERFSHTIDPRTGTPVRHALASITVLHADCMQADALATVLTVLGPEEGLAWAEERGIAALFCERAIGGPVLRATRSFPPAS